MAERIPVPRLVSRSATMWLSVGAAVVGAVGVVVWALLTQPPVNQAAAVVVVLVIALLLGFLIGRRTWIDPAAGTVGRDVCGLVPRTAAWATAERVRITDNRGGQALLEVRGAGDRTSVYLPLVAVDLGGDRSQEPGFLRVLAEQLETWAPQRKAIATALRAQADHLETGGGVRDSPLARRYLARAGNSQS